MVSNIRRVVESLGVISDCDSESEVTDKLLSDDEADDIKREVELILCTRKMLSSSGASLRSWHQLYCQV